MKTIGLIGGMSVESTRLYYDAMNRSVRARLGGLHSAAVIIHSVDFAPIAAMQSAGRWDDAGAVLAEAARGLERAGAACIALATNTMHKVCDHITAAISVPFIHIAEPTAAALMRDARRMPLVLATRFTMEDTFYTGYLRARGLEPRVPTEDGRAEVHRIIYDQLCLGDIRAESRAAYVRTIETAAQAGADSVILGCTEVGLLIGPQNSPLPVYDTTLIHADALIDFALG